MVANQREKGRALFPPLVSLNNDEALTSPPASTMIAGKGAPAKALISPPTLLSPVLHRVSLSLLYPHEPSLSISLSPRHFPRPIPLLRLSTRDTCGKNQFRACQNRRMIVLQRPNRRCWWWWTTHGKPWRKGCETPFFGQPTVGSGRKSIACGLLFIMVPSIRDENAPDWRDTFSYKWAKLWQLIRAKQSLILR